MMNSELKAEWVAALRSGEYSQGRGGLSQYGNFCCLGVFTDLAVKAGLGIWRTIEGVEALEFVPAGKAVRHGDGECGQLPWEVVEWAGLEDSNPTVCARDGFPENLTSLNDDQELSFNDLADLIEEQL